MCFSLTINKLRLINPVLLLIACLPMPAFAESISATWLDAVDIVRNIATNADELQSMIINFLYFSGICFAIKALYHLKVYGEMRTMMASNTSLKQPLTWFLVSMVFMAFPKGLFVIMNSVFFNYHGVLSYSEWHHARSDLHFEIFIDSLFKIVRLIGLIAFSRGWFMIAQSAHQGGSPQATLGKGIIHIVGGIIGINIVRTLNILDNSVSGTT